MEAVRVARPKPPQTTSLVLTLAGVEYRVRRVEPPAGYRRAWRLTRADKKLGRVSHVVAVSGAGDVRCDCPAAKYAPGGIPCKHARVALIFFA